jgi:hypothetical protein
LGGGTQLSIRISMTDHLAVEANGRRLEEPRFPGRQGRILFAYLAVQHGRSVPRHELAELLWGEDLPATWEKALRVLTTKLRALLEECGIDGSSMLRSAFGCYQLTLPADTWIDLDAAVTALERGEAALAGRISTRLGHTPRREPSLLGGCFCPARTDRGSRIGGATSVTSSCVRSNAYAMRRSLRGSSGTQSDMRPRSPSSSLSAKPATAR